VIDPIIERALLDHLAKFGSEQNLPISYEGVTFDKPSSNKDVFYLRVSFLPLPSVSMISGPVTYAGLLAVDVFAGIGSKSVVHSRKASELAYHFRKQSLSREGFEIKLSRRQLPHREQMVTDAPWVFIPVRIQYECFSR
jgi:hypothetical protein